MSVDHDAVLLDEVVHASEHVASDRVDVKSLPLATNSRLYEDWPPPGLDLEAIEANRNWVMDLEFTGVYKWILGFSCSEPTPYGPWVELSLRGRAPNHGNGFPLTTVEFDRRVPLMVAGDPIAFRRFVSGMLREMIAHELLESIRNPDGTRPWEDELAADHGESR